MLFCGQECMALTFSAQVLDSLKSTHEKMMNDSNISKQAVEIEYVQKTGWTFLYYSGLGHLRQLKQRWYLAAPLACHTGLSCASQASFTFTHSLIQLHHTGFSLCNIYLPLKWVSFHFLCLPVDLIFVYYSWVPHVNHRKCDIAIRSKRHSSICVSKDCLIKLWK